MSYLERIKQSATGQDRDRIPRQLAILGAPPEVIDEARSKSDEAREQLFLKFIEGKHGFPLDWAAGSDDLLEELRPLLSPAEKKSLPRKSDFPSDGPAAIATARRALHHSERRLVQTESLGDFSILILVPKEKEQEMLDCIGPWVIPDDPQVVASLKEEPPEYPIALPIAFRRWVTRVPPKTRYMAELLIDQVLPRFIEAGFTPVTTVYGVRNDRVETKAIRLERKMDDTADHLEIRFGKYNDPRFEVHCGRASLPGEWKYKYCGMLVSHGNRQYHYVWGPGFLYPVALWPNWAARRTVRIVASHIDQILHFLETGERGPNIGLTLLKSDD